MCRKVGILQMKDAMKFKNPHITLDLYIHVGIRKLPCRYYFTSNIVHVPY